MNNPVLRIAISRFRRVNFVKPEMWQESAITSKLLIPSPRSAGFDEIPLQSERAAGKLPKGKGLFLAGFGAAMRSCLETGLGGPLVWRPL